MKTYLVIWIYYGIDGAEEGCNRIHAKTPQAAEAEFYKYNRPFWKDEWKIGYSVEGIREVEE